MNHPFVSIFAVIVCAVFLLPLAIVLYNRLSREIIPRFINIYQRNKLPMNDYVMLKLKALLSHQGNEIVSVLFIETEEPTPNSLAAKFVANNDRSPIYGFVWYAEERKSFCFRIYPFTLKKFLREPLFSYPPLDVTEDYYHILHK